MDLWTAFRDGGYNKSPRPWLGYVFLLEECPQSTTPVAVAEHRTSRCSRNSGRPPMPDVMKSFAVLVREGHDSAASFLTSSRESGIQGLYAEPANDLSIRVLAASLVGHAAAVAQMRSGS